MLIHREALELAKLTNTEDDTHALNCLRFKPMRHDEAKDEAA